jgi:hypothetical protein
MFVQLSRHGICYYRGDVMVNESSFELPALNSMNQIVETQFYVKLSILHKKQMADHPQLKFDGEQPAIYLVCKIAVAFSRQAAFALYHSSVRLMPSSNETAGSQPSSRCSLVASIAYRRSWPGLSGT